MENTDDWLLQYEDARDLDGQIRFFVASTIESYLNGIYNEPADYPLLSREQWKNYIWDTLCLELENGDAAQYRHLMFYGKQEMNEIIDSFIDGSPTIQKIYDNRID